MDQALESMFAQARQLVADADRKLAEENERRRECEREVLLRHMGGRLEEAFDFTSKEKLELEPRLDVQGGVGVVEFVVRASRTIFLLSPGEGDGWSLQIIESGRKPQLLGDFQGGTAGEQASRRLAAARIVTAIGDTVQGMSMSGPQPVQLGRRTPGREDVEEPKAKLNYGTMGKFMGY